ncbi:MAG: Plug domain-containing protein, partial [Bacteroidota bacterium]
MTASVNKNRYLSISAMLKHILLPAALFLFHASVVFSQTKDSVAFLKNVKISAIKKQNDFTSAEPVQSLNKETLQQLNAQSVGDAARYFSGVLIKDYGGIGGLKTISVRSLGASNTGIIYDGIPVSDLQTGQIDLSRFSTTFVQSLELQHGSIQHSLLPARTYASAAALSIASNTFSTTNFHQQNWQAGMKAGSFNLWQPFAGIYQPLKKN